MSLKIGDTVRLKSGGPIMTVTGTGNDPKKGQMIWCSWFDNSGKEQTGHWPADALSPAQSGPAIA